MKPISNKILCATVLATGLIAAPVANAGSANVNKENFAKGIQHVLADAKNQHDVLIAKYILELTMGKGNAKRNKPDATHAAWCAKIHKSYDPASNTFTALNGKQYPCRSLLQ